MSRPLVVLRPEPGSSETLALARSMGLTAIAAPLFVVEPVAWATPDPGAYDAIVAGSANAFRHGGPSLAELRSLPVHAVGERTAEAARAAGFQVAAIGAGGLQAVVDAVPKPIRLLRLAGEARVALEIPPSVTLDERVVYRAGPLPLGDMAAEALNDGAVALLHSGAAAQHLARECDRLGIPRSGIALAVLAPRITDAAGEGWAEVACAREPNDAALLALAHDMCH